MVKWGGYYCNYYYTNINDVSSSRFLMRQRILDGPAVVCDLKKSKVVLFFRNRHVQQYMYCTLYIIHIYMPYIHQTEPGKDVCKACFKLSSHMFTLHSIGEHGTLPEMSGQWKEQPQNIPVSAMIPHCLDGSLMFTAQKLELLGSAGYYDD